MRKIFLIFNLFFSVLLIANTPKFAYPLPDFVLSNKFLKTNPAKYINLFESKRGNAILVLKGYTENKMNSVKGEKREWKSQVIFFDAIHNETKKIDFDCFVWAKFIDNEINPLLAITKTKIEGNDFVNNDFEFYNLDGEKIKTLSVDEFPFIGGTYIDSSIDNNFIVFKEIGDGEILSYTIVPVNELFAGKQKKETLKFIKFKFENNNIQNNFLLLGGENIDAIISSGGTLTKISIKNKGEQYWKIDFIGGNIIGLKNIGKHLLYVDCPPYYCMVNIENGKIIKKINQKESKNKHGYTQNTLKKKPFCILNENNKTYQLRINNSYLEVYEKIPNKLTEEI